MIAPWRSLLCAPLLVAWAAGAEPAGVDPIQQRLRDAIEGSRGFEVIKPDLLGEGDGRWDPDPRYPGEVVNCIIWIQYLIAETYGETPEERVAAMDAIRYFGGHVGWSTRKHYVDHWALLEPGPLRPVSQDLCPLESTTRVELDVERFKRSHGFTCPIVGQDTAAFTVAYMDQAATLSCASRLPAGHYIAFAVAKPKYVERHGKSSGPMGLVHGLVVELAGAAPRTSAHLLHASTSSKRVERDALSEYVERMKGIHRGYVLYDLDPGWTPPDRPPSDVERRALACEAALGSRAQPDLE